MARPPKEHIIITVLQKMLFGFRLISGLTTRMWHPCVYVFFWAPNDSTPSLGAAQESSLEATSVLTACCFSHCCPKPAWLIQFSFKVGSENSGPTSPSTLDDSQKFWATCRSWSESPEFEKLTKGPVF